MRRCLSKSGCVSHRLELRRVQLQGLHAWLAMLGIGHLLMSRGVSDLLWASLSTRAFVADGDVPA